MNKIETKVKVDEEKKIVFCGVEIILKNKNCRNRTVVVLIEWKSQHYLQ